MSIVLFKFGDIDIIEHTICSYNEAPRSPASVGRGIKAELRRSQPGFTLESFAAVRPAIHPFSKLQGFQAKANKFKVFLNT